MTSNRGKTWALVLVLACAWLVSAPAFEVSAATFDDLYTVSVESDPTARNQRQDAIRRAMSLLLTRITGRQQAGANPALQGLIDNAESYLDEYAPFDDQIRVGFIPTQIDEALARLDMPIWGEERPSTLLWIAIDFGDGVRAEFKAADSTAAASNPEVIRARSVEAGGFDVGGTVAGVASNALPDDAGEFFSSIAKEMLVAADERGLPLVLPQLDAEDRRYVRFADVWGGFVPFVERAAERYAVDAIVVARVSQSAFGPEVTWTVQRGDRWQTLTGPRVREGIDWLANEFASEYATIGDTRVTRITIRGITSWPDYRVRDYLKSVSSVESVQIESFEAGEFVLRVMARGNDDTQLDRLLTLDGQLVPVEGTEGLVYVPSWIELPELIDSP